MSRNVLIVAHGQPSDPEPAERDLASLARDISAHLNGGFQCRSATLASGVALTAALKEFPQPVIFPFFMADGWFIRTLLPRRLAASGAILPTILTPFGLLPEARDLAVAACREAARRRDWAEAETRVVLAAHGSGANPMPAEAARRQREHFLSNASFQDVSLGFIEEAPRISDVLVDAGPRSILLPLFAARWGHVVIDIPAAVTAAGFIGDVLDPIGTHPDAPAIVAGAIAAAFTE